MNTNRIFPGKVHHCHHLSPKYKDYYYKFFHPTPVIPKIHSEWPQNLNSNQIKNFHETIGNNHSFGRKDRRFPICSYTYHQDLNCESDIERSKGSLECLEESRKKMLPWRDHESNNIWRESCMDNKSKFENLLSSSNIMKGHHTESNCWVGTKFSPRDWNYNTHQLCTGATSVHDTVIMIQDEAKKCIQATGKDQHRTSNDTHDDLSSRLNDLSKWTDKLRDELKYNISQFHELSELKDRLKEIIKNIEKPLDMSKENKITRNRRQGIELVRDAVEDALDRESEVYERRRIGLLHEMEKLNAQMIRLRECRLEIELDIQKKIQAMDTDECARILSTLSKDIGSIEIPQQFGSHSSPTSWLQNTQAIIHKSQDERNLAQTLGIDVSREMLASANDSFGVWYSTNSCLKTRISEIEMAKKQIENHLYKLDQDISTIRMHIGDVREALDAKIPSLQLAQSRLDKRKERPGLELCRDKAMISLLKEIQVLRNAVDILEGKLKELETTLEHLLKTKSTLERDLKLKNIALFIDKQKCLMIRQTFPISTFKEARVAKPLTTYVEEQQKRSLPSLQF